MRILRAIATVLCLGLFLGLCPGLGFAPAGAHELWIEPGPGPVGPDGRIEADLVNGETFKGIRLPYLPRDIRRLSLHLGPLDADVGGRLGDNPTISAPPLGEGLHIIAYVSAPRTVRYDDFAKFAEFAAHKDLGDVAALSQARGLASGPLTEVYGRFSKALVAVGHGQGADRRLGLETELVALDPPRAGAPLRLQLFGPDGARVGAFVELFDRAPDGTVTVSGLRSDAEGIVTLQPVAGHVYMADSVLLRVPAPGLAEETGAVWETLWANLVIAFTNPPLR